jgi:hypothetical protein
MQIHCKWRCKSAFALQCSAFWRRNATVDGAHAHFFGVARITESNFVGVVVNLHGDDMLSRRAALTPSVRTFAPQVSRTRPTALTLIAKALRAQSGARLVVNMRLPAIQAVFCPEPARSGLARVVLVVSTRAAQIPAIGYVFLAPLTHADSAMRRSSNSSRRSHHSVISQVLKARTAQAVPLVFWRSAVLTLRMLAPRRQNRTVKRSHGAIVPARIVIAVVAQAQAQPAALSAILARVAGIVAAPLPAPLRFQRARLAVLALILVALATQSVPLVFRFPAVLADFHALPS